MHGRGTYPPNGRWTLPGKDYTWLPDVVLVPLDSQMTTIDLGGTEPIQMARGSLMTDAEGTRQTTLLFEQGTTAEIVLSDGTTQPITSLDVRTTEYTVGENGPQAMPAELPFQSGYTYAVDFTVDAALADGAMTVRFDRPVIHYVENFLEFPVGGAVPVGSYDRHRGEWIASQNGRIVEVLAITNGMAELDIDGSGQPADAAALAALGVSEAERAELATLYAPGTTLWRVPIPHFSPWDCNWPYGPPPDAGPPDPPGNPNPGAPDPDTCEEGGSIVECQNQVLGERFELVGTAFTLNYRSSRMLGYLAERTVEIPLSGSEIPESLQRIDLEIYVAGQAIRESFPPAPDQHYSFTWDGLDAYGRPLLGVQPIVVRIGWAYPVRYYEPAKAEAAFAVAGGAPVSGSRARGEVIIWKDWSGQVGSWDLRGLGLGGWTLAPHHFYDPISGALLYGDGGQRRLNAKFNAVLTTTAGNGIRGNTGDHLPATEATLYAPQRVAVAPDGSLYISTFPCYVRKVDPQGIISTFAGSGACRGGGDGGSALSARINPQGLAVAPDGTVYIADIGFGGDQSRIWAVGPDGIIRAIAGTGALGYSGDGGPALQARLGYPLGVALGPDGSLYIAEWNNNRVRRVGPDGIITTFAGGGAPPDGIGDGLSAVGAALGRVQDVAVGPHGSVYIAHDPISGPGSLIRRVGVDGIITTVAGGGAPVPGHLANGIPATDTYIHAMNGIDVDRDGALYYTSHFAYVRAVSPDGLVKTIAGTGTSGYNGDELPATQAQLNQPWDVAVAPDGVVYVADSLNFRVRQTGWPLPGASQDELVLAAEDGATLFHFDLRGRHLRTTSALSGADLLTFAYDGAGRLQSVTDGDGNVTSIERDGAGAPTAIVAPFGQRTVLTLDAAGYLAAITNPAGETYSFSYHGAGGLLASYTNPRGNRSEMSYDAEGRLMHDAFPGTGFWDLARIERTAAQTVTLTSAAGHTTTYLTEETPAGVQRRLTTFADGTQKEGLIDADGSRRTNYASGGSLSSLSGPDPRWGMQAPLATELVYTTPGGLRYEQTMAGEVQRVEETNFVPLAPSVHSAAGFSTRFTASKVKLRSRTRTSRPNSSAWSRTGPVSVASPVGSLWMTSGENHSAHWSSKCSLILI
jgi:YD repeat-containing protein